jgi:hypothetical protein
LKSGTFDATLFDDVERTIVSNLSDTWSRFVFVGAYVKYQQGKKSEKEMIEGK